MIPTFRLGKLERRHLPKFVRVADPSDPNFGRIAEVLRQDPLDLSISFVPGPADQVRESSQGVESVRMPIDKLEAFEPK